MVVRMLKLPTLKSDPVFHRFVCQSGRIQPGKDPISGKSEGIPGNFGTPKPDFGQKTPKNTPKNGLSQREAFFLSNLSLENAVLNHPPKSTQASGIGRGDVFSKNMSQHTGSPKSSEIGHFYFGYEIYKHASRFRVFASTLLADSGLLLAPEGEGEGEKELKFLRISVVAFATCRGQKRHKKIKKRTADLELNMTH